MIEKIKYKQISPCFIVIVRIYSSKIFNKVNKLYDNKIKLSTYCENLRISIKGDLTKYAAPPR